MMNYLDNEIKIIEQKKLKKVINGLECCKMPFSKCYDGGCPYFEDEGCKAKLKREALELLKAQEPRVMTLEESSAINGGDIVWIEDRSLNQMIVGIKFQSPSENCYYVMLIGSKRPQPFSKELYEVNWRCWTSRPTDEQREATPWNAQK